MSTTNDTQVGPDKLVDADSVVGTDADMATAEALEWIVRLERRDAECQFRFIDRHCNINSRLSSAMMMCKTDARQLAKAISDQHPKYKARAMLFSTMRKKQQAQDKSVTHP